MKQNDSASPAREYILDFLSSINSPRALAAWLLYENGEHKQLVELTFNPLDYNELTQARDALAATKFLSKATFLQVGNDLRGVALTGFRAAEAQCKETNKRILTSQFRNGLTAHLIFEMRRKIEKVLGEFSPDEFLEGCNWGPGATTHTKRRDATAPRKFQFDTGITSAAYNFVERWFHVAYPIWAREMNPYYSVDPRSSFIEIKAITNTTKIVTVPKNVKTDRTIGIEPGLNLWF